MVVFLRVFLFASILPLANSSRLDLKNSGTYRTIAMNSVFSKAL